MKYVIILGDGMADEPIAQLNGKTPLEVANKPMIDLLSQKGELGLVSTIPEGMSPGSDTANLSVMGYDPKMYYSGRSPLEAISMGIQMKETDISFRCNVVTLSEEESFDDKVIIDHSADEITSEEAAELIKVIETHFGNESLRFYPGVSYRHALIWEGGSMEVDLTPPHNILTKRINQYLPKGVNSDIIYDMMKKSYELLNQHPVNVERRRRGLNPANAIWIWGEGNKPMLPSFKDKYGLKGSMISAVDLLKGIALAANMESIDIDGATGNLHTNYEGKANACIQALDNGQDFVYIHIEAPDECGHRGELDNKVKSIELIDSRIVKPIVDALESRDDDFRILILPDHPTPIAIRTHTSNPVPYVLYDSRVHANSGLSYTEKCAKQTNIYCREGHHLMDYLLEKQDFKKIQ